MKTDIEVYLEMLERFKIKYKEEFVDMYHCIKLSQDNNRDMIGNKVAAFTNEGSFCYFDCWN